MPDTPDTIPVLITAWGFAAGDGTDHKPGDRVEVDPATAKSLVASGHAVTANKTAEKSLPGPQPTPQTR